MLKQPAHAPDEVPNCFGERYDKRASLCLACPVRRECRPLSLTFAVERSLSERVADLAAQLAGAVSEPVEEVYAKLYRDTFGRGPRLRTAHQRATLTRIEDSCRKQKIDLETYIAGNLWAMKAWANKHPRIGFQPSHLSGENALRRYHAYLGRLNRRFHHAQHEDLNGDSLAATLRRQLFLGEFAVGQEFVARWVERGEADWTEAAEAADPPQEWLALESGAQSAYHNACNALGTSRLKREREFARLAAAAALAELYQHGFADRIGFRLFTWPAFAALVRRLTGLPVRRAAMDLSEVSGAVWP